MLASIIVNNYNYGRYLPEAIDSALAQTYAHHEVVVVDDGSTDDSREIIAAYGDRIVSVLKPNGGQATAFNAGFAASRGEIVVFLDADDVLLPTALERAVPLFAQPEVVKVHWPLAVIDRDSRRTGQTIPGAPLPHGDLRQQIQREGPSSSGSPPTSGNAWRRTALAALLPVPEEYRLCADDYLYALAPALGHIERVESLQGLYRLHGQNNYREQPFEEKLAFGRHAQDRQCDILAGMLQRQGVTPDIERWKSGLWFHRLTAAIGEIDAHVPPASPFVLIDDDQWGAGDCLAGRRRFHFLDRDGRYWGPPATDDDAIAELTRRQAAGVAHVVIAWPSFWWLDHYRAFRRHLDGHARRLHQSRDVIVFEMRTP